MKEKLSICVLGDVCPDRRYCKTFDFNNANILFGNTLSTLQGADIALCNLEAPASLRGTQINKCGPSLRCKPSDIDMLAEAGIQAVSLANNHILDYGEEAALDTIASIESRGIKSFGAGKNLAEARKPIFIEKKGWRIGCISFAEHEFNIASEASAGANPFDPYSSFSDVQNAKSKCDFLIVLFHGGIENYAFPSPLLQKKCHAFVDAGADIVLCQHSHCIGTLENYNGVNILYGQGNSLFGRMEDDEVWNTGLLVSINLSQESCAVSFRLIEAGDCGIRFASDEKNEKRLAEFFLASEGLTDHILVKEKWNSFCMYNAKWYLPMLLCWGRVGNKLNRLLNNRLIRIFANRKKQKVAMNLIRCDAHREVVQTILENSQN